MTPRIPRAVAAAATVTCAVAFVLLGVAPVAAESPDEVGWWTEVAVPGPQVATPPSDVPADGLLVEGPADNPTAAAALAFTVPSDAVASTVTLHKASSGVTTPGSGLRLCPLTVPDFSPESGGPMSDAPKWNCAVSVPGTPDSAGTAWTFSVKNLQRAGRLSVAVLPVGSSDRVVLAAPAQDALSVVISDPGTSVPLSDGLAPAPVDSGLSPTGALGPLPPIPTTPPLTASNGDAPMSPHPTVVTAPTTAPVAALQVAFPVDTAATSWGAAITALVLTAMALTTWNRYRQGFFARPADLEHPSPDWESA